MAYVNWQFGRPGLAALRHEIDVHNDPGPQSHLYLQLYDANVGTTGQYYGLQTTGMVIFSQFGTTDLNNVRTGAGYAEPLTTEGPFVSLRWNRGRLPVGHYSVEMRRAEFDGTGDWLDYYVAFPGESMTYVGGIRFPRAMPSVPVTFADNGGTWVEAWDNNNGEGVVYPVAQWKVAVSVQAEGRSPKAATLAYETMPNADITAHTDGSVEISVGGETPRCTPEGTVTFSGATPTFGPN